MKKLIFLFVFFLPSITGFSQTTTKKNVSTNGAGWKRVAYSTNNVGRGFSKVTILTIGGASSPTVTEIGWFKDWSNNGGINVISNSRNSFWTDCRITYDGVRSYLEVKFAVDISLLVISLDQKEWGGVSICSNPLPDGGGTIIASAKIERLNFGENDFMLSYSGNVGIGTISPNYKLDVNGTIRARELKVDMQGADFVFEDAYKLRSLEEVEEFINTNKHLPGVASAKEMQENGVNQSEMNKLLLQKVEELTLHIINLNKRIENIEMKSK